MKRLHQPLQTTGLILNHLQQARSQRIRAAPQNFAHCRVFKISSKPIVPPFWNQLSAIRYQFSVISFLADLRRPRADSHQPPIAAVISVSR